MKTNDTLSAESLAAINYEVQKYPKGKAGSAVMSALRIAQKEKGWLSPDTMAFIADYLSLPEMRVYEVATFYNMYDTTPVGRHKLCLCTNLPCALMGAMKTKAAIEETLGMRFGETNEEWTLKEGECFGACGDGPVIIENNQRMHSKVTPDKVAALVATIKDDKKE